MNKNRVPHVINLAPGEKVFICQCGLSKNKPYCDGSHKESPDKSFYAYSATVSETRYVCGCSHSRDYPWCDGSHLNIDQKR